MAKIAEAHRVAQAPHLNSTPPPPLHRGGEDCGDTQGGASAPSQLHTSPAPTRQGLQRQHALQGDTCPVGCFFIHDYLVDDLALNQSFEYPGQVSGMDAVHG